MTKRKKFYEDNVTLHNDNWKNYKAFGNFLTRNGVEKGNALAGFFIEIFALSSKTEDWKKITLKLLKDKNILPTDKHKTLNHWREEMVEKGILECKAKGRDLKDDKANFACSLFKPGSKIKKYIRIAIKDNLPEKIHNIECHLENLSDEKAENSRVDNIEKDFNMKLNDMERKIEGMCKMLMRLLPPDTPERRQIIIENIDDEERCIELLTAELDKEAIEQASKAKDEIDLNSLN